jgi:hypothetical protein
MREAAKEAKETKPEKPAVIHIHNGGGKKSISVNRTANGLEGTMEET